MNISASEEYGLRCALQLVKEYSLQKPISASVIAELEGISLEYVSKFMHLFRKAGIATAERGVHGGFLLAKDPSAITLKEVFAAIHGRDPSESGHFCEQFSGKLESCIHIGNCSVRPLWTLFNRYYEGLLKKLTLADLVAEESVAQTKMEEILSGGVSQIPPAGLPDLNRARSEFLS